jgi:predicted transposase YdaD
MDEFKKAFLVSIKKLQNSLNEPLRSVDLLLLSNEELIEFYGNAIIELNKVHITQEAFNGIIDLRPYLLNSPKDYTQECLHYLGDAARKWWWKKKFTEGYEAIESLLEENKVTDF